MNDPNASQTLIETLSPNEVVTCLWNKNEVPYIGQVQLYKVRQLVEKLGGVWR